MAKKVRVRFAPSPTGGLHLGGVRTVLYNYLFARQHGGDFVLRIEDTDQSRYVPGAEEYIYECLKWCGLEPDESPLAGGPHAPYRQSERKELYRQYAEFLVQEGKAYYAFDRPDELESMRERFKTAENPSPQYDHNIRMQMRNSCSLTFEETERMLNDGVPHVIRIRMPEDETVTFTDMIRGEISFNTGLVDDKVLLKADGMPTYHLAVVVDDYLMKITHAFRGEEWLPSSPVHILLWKYLGWEEHMPQWAHLPLILKPDGNGKLSKRDGDRLGFPVFAMNWTVPGKGDTKEELIKGFRELGFMPEAFVNLLAMLGWNDGTDQELFTLDELKEKFSLDRVHKGGAKFDFEKAKWFNHEWIKRSDVARLLPDVKQIFETYKLAATDEKLEKVIALVKERCTLLTDFVEQGKFFFQTPQQWDLDAIKPKWNDAKQAFFGDVINYLQQQTNWNAPTELENGFKELAAAKQIKPGEVLLPLRIMLVGGKFGPGVFEIASIIGKEETVNRIKMVLEQL